MVDLFTPREMELIAAAHESGREYERRAIGERADEIMGLTPEPPAPTGVDWDEDEIRSPLERLRSALLDTHGLDTIGRPQAIVDDVLYADSIAWLIGSPGHGKSFVALDIAGCVAAGQTWQGHPTHAGTVGPVLYVIAEGASGLRQRVRAWESSMNATMVDVLFLPVPVQVALDGDWSALCELSAEMKPCLVVVDTQARSTVGMEENSAKDMGIFVAAIERLRRASGACVLVVHHQGRNGDHMRGSTALEGAATTIMRVSKDDELITVVCAKQKDAEPFDDIALRLVPYLESAVLSFSDGTQRRSGGLSHAALKMARAWLEHHGDDWVGAGKLVDIVAPRMTFYRNVKELQMSGAVQVDRSSRYPTYRLLADVGQPGASP